MYDFSLHFCAMLSEQTGNFIFRYRGQIPIIFLCFSILLGLIFNRPIVTLDFLKELRQFSLGLIVFGAFYRCFTIGFAAPHTSGRNRNEQVAHQLNTSGAYSMSQHPLYFANAFIWIGISTYSNLWVFLFGGILLSWFLIFFLIHRETKFLAKQFGDTYLQWKQKTPLFFPNPLKFRFSVQSFQWVRLFATEYPTWVSVHAGLLILALLSDFMVYHVVIWKLLHSVILVSGTTIGFLGRFFKYVVVRRWLNRPI